MTKKHYEMIASNLKEVRKNLSVSEHYVVDATALVLASDFAKDNARFNRMKFLDACGVEIE